MTPHDEAARLVENLRDVDGWLRRTDREGTAHQQLLAQTIEQLESALRAQASTGEAVAFVTQEGFAALLNGGECRAFGKRRADGMTFDTAYPPVALALRGGGEAVGRIVVNDGRVAFFADPEQLERLRKMPIGTPLYSTPPAAEGHKHTDEMVCAAVTAGHEYLALGEGYIPIGGLTAAEGKDTDKEHLVCRRVGGTYDRPLYECRFEPALESTPSASQAQSGGERPEKVRLFWGVVGDYDGAYDMVRAEDYDKPENALGEHPDTSGFGNGYRVIALSAPVTVGKDGVTEEMVERHAKFNYSGGLWLDISEAEREQAREQSRLHLTAALAGGK